MSEKQKENTSQNKNRGTYVTEFIAAMSASTDVVETANGNNLLIKAYRKGKGGIM